MRRRHRFATATLIMVRMLATDPLLADPPEKPPRLPIESDASTESDDEGFDPTGDVDQIPSWSNVRKLPGELSEISGLVWAEDRPDRVYAHNDSGDTPTFYAIDQNGRILDRISLRGARHVDWEDAFLTRWNDQTQLWAADIGDNLARRSEVVIYAIDLPATNPRETSNSTKVRQVQPRSEIRLRYPDGPRDCEAIAFDPRTNQVVMIAKTPFPWSRLYAASLSEDDIGPDATRSVTRSSMKTLRYVGNLAVPMVTALDIHPRSGRWLVVNYFHAFVFSPRGTGERDAGEPEIWKQTPLTIPLPDMRQVEAACWGQDNRVIIAGEGSPPLWAKSGTIR